MSQHAISGALLESGGLFEAKTVDRPALLKQAEALGWGVFEINCDRARSRSAILRAIAKAVDYPEFFGNDLDALYDCLTDTLLEHKPGLLMILDKLHSGDPTLTEAAEAVIAVFHDTVEFARNNQRVFVFWVDHAGKHPDPEPGISPTPYSGSRDDD